MKQLLFASSNPNKIKEIKQILGKQFEVIGLKDVGIVEEIPEPGNTIAENSLLKAKYVSEILNNQGKQIPVFADDSGLEVQALGGAPGVHSARYAGVPKNDGANNQKLLRALSNVTKRNARFITVITLIMGDEIKTFEGEIKGTIAFEPRGSNGFGYDPLFIPQGYRSTFAELDKEVKNNISHRAIAVRALASYFKNV